MKRRQKQQKHWSMQFKIDQDGDVAIVRYRGRHACENEDHEQDRVIQEFITNRLKQGQPRILVDITKLRIVYSSSLGCLWKAWSIGTAGLRIAILWSDRQKVRWSFLEAHGTVDFFQGEQEALEFLRSDQPMAYEKGKQPESTQEPS